MLLDRNTLRESPLSLSRLLFSPPVASCPRTCTCPGILYERHAPRKGATRFKSGIHIYYICIYPSRFHFWAFQFQQQLIPRTIVLSFHAWTPGLLLCRIGTSYRIGGRVFQLELTGNQIIKGVEKGASLRWRTRTFHQEHSRSHPAGPCMQTP